MLDCPVSLAGMARCQVRARTEVAHVSSGITGQAWPVAEARFSLLAWEARTGRQMRGDGEAEAKYDTGVNCDLCGHQLAADRESTSKRPGAGGNIGGRRRADLAAQDFDLCGWQCACCGPGGLAVAQPTARSCPAGTRGECRWLRDDGFPAGFQALCLSGNDCKGTARSAAAPVTRSSCWRRTPAKTGPPVTGTLALQDARRRGQGNEEDR